jgi:hypothetical protein
MPRRNQVLIACRRAKRRGECAKRDRAARALIEKLHALRKEPVREDVLYDECGLPRL